MYGLMVEQHETCVTTEVVGTRTEEGQAEQIWWQCWMLGH